MPRDVVPAAEAFAALAAEIQAGAAGPSPSGTGQAPSAAEIFPELGDLPEWLQNWSVPAWKANAALRGAPDLERLRDALLATDPTRLKDRNTWRHRCVAPLAHEAVLFPDLEPELRRLMHEASDRPGAYDGAYPAAENDAEWDRLLSDTEARLDQGRECTTLGTIFAMAREDGWRDGAGGAAPDTGDASSRLDIAALHIAARPARRTKRKTMLGGVAIIGHVSVIVSPGGLAKSTIATTGCVAVASGKPIFGVPLVRPMPVLMVNAEDDSGEVRLRCEACLAHFKIPLHQAGDLYVCGADALGEFAFTEVDPTTRRERLRLRDIGRLRQLIRQTRAKLVVLDPWSALVPVGANDNGLMYQLMRALKQIAAELECAVVIVAHTRKGAAANGDGAEGTLGAVAVPNAARAVFAVVRPSPSECERRGVAPGDEGNMRDLVAQKANLVPGGTVLSFRLVGVPMDNAEPPEWPEQDWVAVAEPFVPQAPGSFITPQMQREALVTLAKGAQGGTCHYSLKPQAKSRFYLPDVAAALTPHLPGAPASRREGYAKRIVDDLLARGWIGTTQVVVPKTRGGGPNRREGVVVRWVVTPWAGDPQPGPFVA
ncbi:hypothetical protein GCM10010964_42840 [Caldovatus sediminis]|uniref:AAA family ATPase n=1 Tax=Caldovatus sediminis TaxID=2041189 RepID=A0A8J2ZFH9_9PROT|nr:AAA family ATPase [Caldovatus sediminis]GGG51005.1 hypothetical protein GCM10010964_42840 [Caldovatus sediminis]